MISKEGGEGKRRRRMGTNRSESGESVSSVGDGGESHGKHHQWKSKKLSNGESRTISKRETRRDDRKKGSGVTWNSAKLAKTSAALSPPWTEP